MRTEPMLTRVENRELIELSGPEGPIRGTYHRLHEERYLADSNSMARERVGVLFLNGLYATRAGNGNSATYWADSLAELGYPSFRIDLPGFGDSSGAAPTDPLAIINAGGCAEATAGAIKEIVRCFGLEGIVIAGHCAGAVSAIYGAAARSECRGLVLMDPYFYLPRVEMPKVRQQLNLWARRSRIGGALSRAFDLYKRIRLILDRSNLPENANVALLKCWKQVAAAGLPVLILKAPSRGATSAKPRMGEFDYLGYILRLAGRQHRVQLRIMETANHSFSNQEGRLAVRREVEGWIQEFFPLTRREDIVAEGTVSKVMDGAV